MTSTRTPEVVVKPSSVDRIRISAQLHVPDGIEALCSTIVTFNHPLLHRRNSTHTAEEEGKYTEDDYWNQTGINQGIDVVNRRIEEVLTEKRFASQHIDTQLTIGTAKGASILMRGIDNLLLWSFTTAIDWAYAFFDFTSLLSKNITWQEAENEEEKEQRLQQKYSE